MFPGGAVDAGEKVTAFGYFWILLAFGRFRVLLDTFESFWILLAFGRSRVLLDIFRCFWILLGISVLHIHKML